MEKERIIRSGYQAMGLGYYHLCTDGWKEGKLFNSDSQFAYGMSTIALSTLRFGIKIYAFELMENHVHIILSGKGSDCCKVFFYLKKRVSSRLVKDGFPPLPAKYGFKLIPIENEQQLKNNLLYVARNPYEKRFAAPGAYPWGSSYLLYSRTAGLIQARRVDEMSGRAIVRLIGSHTILPGNWLVNDKLGVLPISFVESSKVYGLFPSVKDYYTSLVKDYESFARIASDIGEGVSFDQEETRDIVRHLLQKHFEGKALRSLQQEDKYRLAAMLSSKYGLDSCGIASVIYLPERVVRQALGSKDYGPRRPV